MLTVKLAGSVTCAFGTVVRIVQLDQVLGAHGKGHLNLVTQKLAGNFRFQFQVTALARDDQCGNRTGITQFASPRSFVFRIAGQEAALLNILAAKVVAIKIATVNRFLTH